MKYKALVSCAGISYSLIAGQEYELDNEELVKDLLNAKFIKSLDGEIQEFNDVQVESTDPVENSTDLNETESTESDVLEASALEGKKTSEIKDICRSMGIKAEGTKADMISAILKVYNV